MSLFSRQVRSTYRPKYAPFLLNDSSLPHQTFHSSRNSYAEDDYYATLGLELTATSAEVKKSFYALSKLHHPDHNPDNQEAAGKKFIAIAEAYATLGNATKREKYDRERIRAAPKASGSYSSGAGGAGGRTASGLSRRRGHFKGPPPSFYRSGGWGAQSAKRQANAHNPDEYAPGPDAQRQQGQANAGSYQGTTEDWPFGSDPNDVPHFDRGSHFRTQTSVEEQLKQGRRKRRKEWEEELRGETESGFVGTVASFSVVGAVIVLGLSIPMFFFYENKDVPKRKAPDR